MDKSVWWQVHRVAYLLWVELDVPCREAKCHVPIVAYCVWPLEIVNDPLRASDAGVPNKWQEPVSRSMAHEQISGRKRYYTAEVRGGPCYKW